jgi:hypothetical protein
MNNWKNRFTHSKPKDLVSQQQAAKEIKNLLSFQTKAQTTGVDIVCKQCKAPLWNVVINLKDDPTGKTRVITSYKDVPDHSQWWEADKGTYKPDCPLCGKSFMNAVPIGTDENGKTIVMHKPVIL